jgi:hypothetical protein
MKYLVEKLMHYCEIKINMSIFCIYLFNKNKIQMNAEKKDYLSFTKGYYPDSRSYFNDCIEEIFNKKIYSQPFFADSLNIQHVKSENDDYEDRGGK